MVKFQRMLTSIKEQDVKQEKIESKCVTLSANENHTKWSENMNEKNNSVSYIYDSKVYKNNVSVAEDDYSEILGYLIKIIKEFLSLFLRNCTTITTAKNAKNDAQFENIIGIFRAKYREQAGVEKSVLTTFFEKQNVAMLLEAY
jgi:hypothetical protein